MPGKHVRFADENTFYSPAPSTPSPSHSISSLPSSSGPLTPPQNEFKLLYSPSKIPASPLPSGFVAIHPLLAFDPFVQPTPYILAQPPHTIKYTSALAESATTPPLPRLTLLSPALPWALVIDANTDADGKVGAKGMGFVTVWQVLEALYRFLRRPVTTAEYASLPSDVARAHVGEAFHARWSSVRGKDESREEYSKGVKRVDFLMEKLRFMGLSCTKQGPDVWTLNVA
ncbi:hypothetical protein BJ138DRAFT_1174138 [Hygrophoropsis aurantiaca]|uniref:Uncharacterized protein n=1 Tax=Hygrophoropsis aurantiaca TaxID=72124 RepID=A0ACB8A6A1_9AGAM|nr:hypothetical protein BJ138DRAFT_1174138 [Hygrophoropsis aurantiaca]